MNDELGCKKFFVLQGIVSIFILLIVLTPTIVQARIEYTRDDSNRLILANVGDTGMPNVESKPANVQTYSKVENDQGQTYYKESELVNTDQVIGARKVSWKLNAARISEDIARHRAADIAYLNRKPVHK